MRVTALCLLFLICSQHVYCAFPIEHWVVLMMENRSFDHMLGFLKRDVNKNIDGVTGDESNPYDPTKPSSPRVPISSNSPYVDPNAGHSYWSTLIQIFGRNDTSINPPPMNGFVLDAERMSAGWGPEVMSCFNHSSVPVITTLALEYGLIDSWFSSLPGPTEPNRAFLQSCTSSGVLDNGAVNLAKGFPGKTLLKALGESGYSWNVYFSDFPTAFFMRELREYPLHFHWLSKFYEDCQNGNLPTYSFLEPSYLTVPFVPATDQHPDHNVEDGEQLIKTVYEALRASPQWEKSALIITYDEHGGFYDHAPTPLNGVPNPDGISSGPPFNFNFDRLGIRVPTVIVSPWIKKGTLIHEPNGPTPTSQYEHCSVAATLRKVLNVTGLPLTKRDSWASTFEHIFNLDAPRQDCPLHLPSPPTSPRSLETMMNLPLNDLQQIMLETTLLMTNHNNNNINDNDRLKRDLMTESEAGTFIIQKMEEYIKKKQ